MRKNGASEAAAEFQTAAVYEALHALSQGFGQVFSAMDQINQSGLANCDVFEGCRTLVKQAAAWASHQVAEAVRERELKNWSLTEREWLLWQEQGERESAALGTAHAPIATVTPIPKGQKKTKVNTGQQQSDFPNSAAPGT